jgi:hypothetical protein
MSEPKRSSDLSQEEKRGLLARLLREKVIGSLSQEDIGAATTDLQPEVFLDPSIRSDGRSFQWQPPTRAVLLTGATGFVGSFLLSELLRQTQADIYCLVRASSSVEGMGRLQASLASRGLWSEEDRSRILPVVGDLSRPLFALSEADFIELAETVDTIYHAGALVKWIYPYQSLKATNVFGTQEILRLASRGPLKPVHFISTHDRCFPHTLRFGGAAVQRGRFSGSWRGAPRRLYPE